MNQEINFDKFIAENDEALNNPIVDSFKKMMEEERNTEYGKVFEYNYTEEFYDAEADLIDENETLKEFKSHFIGKPIESDAILNCPGCMSTLTIDCQQHEIYKNQFRAMFVENCRTDESENVICPIGCNERKKPNSGETMLDDIFHPVYCQICGTKVGLINNKEVYHFFNVLPSD